MLVFPPWTVEYAGEGCRTRHWALQPLAPYVARTMLPQETSIKAEEDYYTSGGSSPERCSSSYDEIAVCEWRGCAARFSGVSRLSAHVARTHAHPHHDGLFYCGWQGCTRPQRGFNARYKMLVHIRTHTNERPHGCTHCHKSFSRAENLKIHLRSHSGEKPYVCQFEGCGKAYSNSSDRFKHTRTHTVDKPYCCKVLGCNKRYTDPSSLRKHVKTYKHFSPNSHEDKQSIATNASPLRIRDTETHITSTTERVSPDITPAEETNIFGNKTSHVNGYDQVQQITYIKPLTESVMYSIRVPMYEMSYAEYTHMYEHAYRSYYSNAVAVPRPIYNHRDNVIYEEQPYQDFTLTDISNESSPEKHDTENIEEPLNLKCVVDETKHQSLSGRCANEAMRCQIVPCMEFPLDLSTKS